MKVLLCIVCIFIGGCTQALRAQFFNFKALNPIDSIITDSDYSEDLLPVLQKKDSFEIQIIYTRIYRDPFNKVSLKTFYYNEDSSRYFYPASLVKLPVCAFALEKINELKNKKINKFSPIGFGADYKCQTALPANKKSEESNGIADFIRRMLLVSDNESYSRTFEFLGQEYINKKLAERGYDKCRILHRFNPDCDSTANRHTNPYYFLDKNGDTLFRAPSSYNPVQLRNPYGNAYKGISRIENGKLTEGPRDFSRSNFIPLRDAHSMLISIIFPESVEPARRFKLDDEDYRFIRKNMSTYPEASGYDEYNRKNGFKDSHKKYFYFGRAVDTISNPDFKIFNVVGMSYGFISECAYFADRKNNLEFFLSAVIYTNKSGIINSGNYEYTTVGLPFMEKLGKVFFRYELNRPKDFIPDLRIFFSE